jgi:hypothetical protein
MKSVQGGRASPPQIGVVYIVLSSKGDVRFQKAPRPWMKAQSPFDAFFGKSAARRRALSCWRLNTTSDWGLSVMIQDSASSLRIIDGK